MLAEVYDKAMTTRARFTSADVTRAVKGAMAAGLTPTRIEIDRKGSIVLLFGEDEQDDDISKYIGKGVTLE